VVTVVGVAVLAVGVALLALPGPGVLVIALGFFILSMEYEWARARLEKARKSAADLADKAVSNPLSTVGSVLGALAIIAAGIIVGTTDFLPLTPNWWAGGSLIAGGLVALVTILVSLVQAKQQPDAAARGGVDPRSDVPVEKS
jgi:hypothetical protein